MPYKNREDARVADARYRDRHRERKRARDRRWVHDHPATNTRNSLAWRRKRRDAVLLPALACVYCGATAALEVDHVIPIARGGTDDAANTVPACAGCNRHKGTKTGDEFRVWLAEQPPTWITDDESREEVNTS